jgi:environmental stress-induced protein Ves
VSAGRRELRAPDRVRVLPWKNGRGATEEILIDPEDASFAAGTFRWRLSKALVDSPGPFSSFPGFERILVPWSGGGLELRHDDGAPVRLAPLVAARFSGDARTFGAPLPVAGVADAPPVRDANLFLRRGVVTGDLTVHRLDAPLPLEAVGTVIVLHCAAGSFCWRDDDSPDAPVLVEGATLVVRDAARLRGVAASVAGASAAPPILFLAAIRPAP